MTAVSRRRVFLKETGCWKTTLCTTFGRLETLCKCFYHIDFYDSLEKKHLIVGEEKPSIKRRAWVQILDLMHLLSCLWAIRPAAALKELFCSWLRDLTVESEKSTFCLRINIKKKKRSKLSLWFSSNLKNSRWNEQKSMNQNADKSDIKNLRWMQNNELQYVPLPVGLSAILFMECFCTLSTANKACRKTPR